MQCLEIHLGGNMYMKRKKRGMFLTVLTLLVFLISISALGENYKKAYRQTILKFEKSHGRDDDYRKKISNTPWFM